MYIKRERKQIEDVKNSSRKREDASLPFSLFLSLSHSGAFISQALKKAPSHEVRGALGVISSVVGYDFVQSLSKILSQAQRPKMSAFPIKMAYSLFK